MVEPQPSSAELIAQYAALIQPFQRFLQEQRAEQQRLLAEMQAAEPAGSPGEGTGSGPSGGAAGAAPPQNPVQWLRDGEPAGPDAGETDLPTDGTTPDGPGGAGELPLSRLVEMGFGGTGEALRHALATTDASLLPPELRHAIEDGTQEEVARALVRARQEMALPPRLAEVVAQLEEDPHFRQVAGPHEDEEPDHDPEPYF